MTSENQLTLEIDKWAGLNTVLDPSEIGDFELSECINFDIGLGQELKKRPGFQRIDNGSIGAARFAIIGLFKTATFQYLLGVTATNFYRSLDGISWTLVGAYDDIQHGIQYADNFYLVRGGGTVLRYDGTTVTALAGSPSGTFCTVFKDRLFVFNTKSTTVSSRFYFSGPGDFTSWPSTNFIDVQVGDGDKLIVCHPIQDRILIWKTRSIHVLYVSGSPTGWILRLYNSEIGCLSRYTLKEIDSKLYFLDVNGVYETDTVNFKLISDSIRNQFLARTTELADVNLDFAGRLNDRYILLLRAETATPKVFVYYFKLGIWTQWELAGTIKPMTMITLDIDDTFSGLFCGEYQALGYVHKLVENSFQDKAVDYESRLTTKEYTLGAEDRFKRGKLITYISKGEGDLTIQYHVDGEDSEIYEQELEAERKFYKATGPGYFRRCSVKFAITESVEFALYALNMVFHTKREVTLSGI